MKKIQNIKAIGERDILLSLENEHHQARIVKIGKALSSPVRLQMMNLLTINPLSVQEIAKALNIPISSTAMHIACLEDAKLAITETQPGLRGSMRVCLCTMRSIHIDATEPEFDLQAKSYTVDMPIGNYYHWDVSPTCGLADLNGMMGSYDTPKSFYSPFRMNAQLIWFQHGFIEYRFPNYCEGQSDQPQEIAFSLELCSEAPGYAENWPSDITISVNGQELGTYRSPGDFGARRGILTPDVWQHGRTQYGLLKTFAVRSKGSYIDGELVNSNVTIDKLALDQTSYISLVIQIKEDAQYVGGINIFGEKYGDYAQGIVMRIVY